MRASVAYPFRRQARPNYRSRRTFYGPLLPAELLVVDWSGITLHWLSDVPGRVCGAIYANLTTGADREALARRVADDWATFCATSSPVPRSRRRLRRGSAVPLMGRRWMRCFGGGTASDRVRPDLLPHLEPHAGALGQDLLVVDSRLPAAYARFVRAITEHPFFRWLDTDRSAAERTDVIDKFYRRLEALLTRTPVPPRWGVVSLRIRRRARS